MELLSKLPLADVPYTSSMQLFLFLTALMFLPFVIFEISIRSTASNSKSNFGRTCNSIDNIYNETSIK